MELYFGTIVPVLALALIALFACDIRQFPICPQCHDNLRSRRLHFFQHEANCLRHKRFLA